MSKPHRDGRAYILEGKYLWGLTIISLKINRYSAFVLYSLKDFMKLPDIISNLKSNIVTITLACYGVGLLYNMSFYNQFNIPIIYYLSINDMLLFTVRILGISIIWAMFMEVLFYNLLGNFINKLYRKIFRREYTKEDSYDRFIGFIQTLTWLVVYFAMPYINLIRDGLFLYQTTPILAYFLAGVKMKRDFKFNDAPIPFLLISATLILWCSYYQTDVVLDKKYKTKIAFTTDKQYIHTLPNTTFYYLGETTSHLFIYDESLDATTAYSKSEIKNLKYFKNN